jgi:rhodanese-related sulfurtransferase
MDTMAPPIVPTIGPGEARTAAAAGARFLDVRERSEWDAGRVAEALWIPLGELATRQGELPRDAPIVVICRSGGRSAVATRALLDAGFDATNLAGGMQAWAAAGEPVVSASGGPGVVA